MPREGWRSGDLRCLDHAGFEAKGNDSVGHGVTGAEHSLVPANVDCQVTAEITKPEQNLSLKWSFFGIGRVQATQ